MIDKGFKNESSVWRKSITEETLQKIRFRKIAKLIVNIDF